ncbi:hypothetical protein [Sphingomonas sp.]|uniref:hypothetical protein n=1 Tax=Sphingomonas sp. TaxID=28214 RepID=UPI003B3B7173
MPNLLDVVRADLHRVLDAGLDPVELLVHGSCLPTLVRCAKIEGVFEDESPSEILGLPLMLSNNIISAQEGARIVCQGDATHAELLRRRGAGSTAASLPLDRSN